MSEPFVFDPRCDLCKEPFGAAVCGTAVTFHCRPLASEHFSHCALVAVCEFSGTRQELEQLLAYISDNFDYVCDYCAKYIPRIKPNCPDATYLMWLDCRDLNMSNEELRDFFIRH